MWQDRIIKFVFQDNLFSLNFCYFDKPIFPYSKQQGWELLSGKYSEFELKKIYQLIGEYATLKKPMFKTSFIGDLVEVSISNNTNKVFIIEHYKKRGFCRIKIDNKYLTKSFENTLEAIEYVNNYYPKLILNKKHLIF